MPYFLFLLGDQGDGIANSVRCTSMSGSSISNEEKYGSLGYFLQATHLMCKSNKVGRWTISVAGRASRAARPARATARGAPPFAFFLPPGGGAPAGNCCPRRRVSQHG